MATSPLRLMPEALPVRLMPGEGQELADKYAVDAAGGNAFTNAYTGARIGGDANRAAAEESSLRAQGGAANLLRAEQLRSESLGLQTRAQAYAAPTQSYEDVMEQGIGSVPGYLAGQVGQGLGSSVDQMATGGALGVAGGLLSLAPNPLLKMAGQGLRAFGAPAAMYKMNADMLKGEAYNTIARDPTAMQRGAQEIDDEVSAHGYRAAVMDTASQLLPTGRATGMFGKALSKVPMSAKFAGGVALEGATETGQQISQHFAHEALNPNRDTSGDASENINSFIGGAAGGTGMNAIGHLGEAALTRLGTQGDGKRGDRISLVDGMKSAEAGVSPKDQASRFALLRGDAGNALDMAAPDFEATAAGLGGARKAALLEELTKSKLPNAAELIAKVSAVDTSDPISAFDPALDEAFNAVVPKAGLMSPEAFATLGGGKKKKSEQVLASDMGSKTGEVPDVSAKGAARAAKDALTAFGSETSAAPPDASTHAARSDYNSKLLWQHFNSGTTETSIPVNRSSKDVVDMLGDEIASMASQGVREAPTPAELQRAATVGRALASLLGPKVQGVLDTIAQRNDVKIGLTKSLVESPVFQAMYEKAVSLHDGSTTHETEAVSRDERVAELVGMVPTSVAMSLLDDGVDIHSPKVGHYLVNAIEALSQGDDKQRMELNKRFTKPVVDKMVDLMGHGAPIEARDVPVKSVSGKTAATDSDTAGVNEGEAGVSSFEERQAQKSLDKSPPESLVFHHGRGVGPVTKLKDAFNDISTGKLPRLILDGQHNTVPDGKGGKPVEAIARLLRNATKTLRGRDGKWSLGRNHALRAASALEVMDSANINDSKREQLMFRYIEQEAGPDVTDLKNMLGVVKSLEAYDRQYTAATIKREKLSPGGGKLSMVEADELVHPGGSQGTLSALADLAATPEDAALARSTFTMNTATRNTVLMGVVKRAKTEALKQLTQTNGFRSFVATTQANESRTPEFKELVNHFFSKRHMVVAEHKSDGDYLKMDLATFKTMAHDGLSLLATASNIGAKAKGSKAFQVAAQIRAEHEMGLLRWYHSDYSPSKPGKGDFDDKSAHVVIQAKDLVAWVRAQRNDHTIGKGDGSVRGESFGETRKNEDYLRDLTQGIMGLVDQGLVKGMPYIINGEVHDKTNPTDEERGFSGEDGSFELYTNEDGKVDLTKVNPKDLAGREEWFEEDAVETAATKMTYDDGRQVKSGVVTKGIPKSIKLAGRSYGQMVSARKAGYKLHKQAQEEFDATQGPRNRALGEQVAQDKHDAEVAGIDYASRKELLNEDEMTAGAADKARGEAIDNTDMQSQEQQDEAEDDTNGFSKFVDEREHIELMTSVLKSAADRAVRPLNPSTAFGLEGAGVADGLRKDYFASGASQEKLTDAIQRIMSYARSFNRPTSVPSDTMLTSDPSKPIQDDMLLGGRHYIAPLAMLLTPKFMAQVADTRKADLPLFEQLRSFTAKNMLMMMEPDPMSGIPELGGAKLAMLIGALSGNTDADKQTGVARPDQLKWTSQDVSAKGRDAFLQGLIKDSTGKATVRKRARFVGMDYESIISRYEKSAERVSNERIIKGEERLAAMEEKLKALEPGSDEGYALAKKIDALRKNIHDAYARPGLEKLNTAATGDQTEQVSVKGTEPASKSVRRKTAEAAQPEVGPATPLGVRQKVNQKQSAEANEGGLGRTTTLASSLSQETVDLKTEEANGRVDALAKNVGGAVDRLRAKPVVAKNEKSAAPAGLLANPPTAPAAHQAKETAKLVGADLVLSPISTPGYAGDLGRAAQAEGKLLTKVTPDVAGKTVLVSVPGKNRGFTAMPALIARVTKALDNGATVRTDNQDNAERAWNIDGEGALRAALIAGGYVETSGKEFSTWRKGGTTPVAAKSTLREAIDKKQEFLRNPPDDYTTAKAVEVKAWAEKQLVRVQAELAKGESDKLEDMAADLKRMVKDATRLVEADTELEAKLGPQGVMKNEQAAPVEATTSAPFMPPPNFNEIIKTRSWLQKVLGPNITVMMEAAFPGMTWNGDWDAAKNLMRIATANPVGIMTVAHHEAVHALFSKIMAKSPEAKELLERTFGTPQMRKRLASMLTVKHDGSDAAKAKAQALHDLIMGDQPDSAEERVAYGFQFFKTGMLAIEQKPRNFFEKVQALMRKVFGAVRDSEKALAILDSFDAGKLSEPSAAGLAIQKIMQTGEWRAGFMKRIDKQAQAAYAEVMTNEMVGLNSESAAAKLMTRLWYTNPARAESADKPGVINLTQQVTRQFHNRLDLALAGLAGADADTDLKALGEALNAHTEPKMPHVAKAKRAVQALLKQYHAYAKEAGLDLGERFGTSGDGEYYTRVMDLEYLVDHKEEFVAMLTKKYPHVLKSAMASLRTSVNPLDASESMPVVVTELEVAHKLYENFINREGVDDSALAVSREDGILNPLFTAGEMRKLHWIRDEDIAPFLSTNVVATLTQYLRQGVRAAEYTRGFGRGGERLRDAMARAGDSRPVEGAGGKVRVEKYAEDGPVLTELKAAAAKLKLEGKKADEWVDRRMEDLERMNGAMEGSLGKDISPKYRKFQGAVMTMQTLRLLPFMLFSSMMDPNSIRVAGGTNKDMFDAYKRGFGAVWDNWKDMLLGNPANMRDVDADEMAALEAGAIDNLIHLEQMGTVASSEYSAGVTREINHTFFKAIGITHWDRAMRIMAVRAARRSIASMIRGDSKEHSARWLEEVGLKEGQGTVNDDGMLITTRRELAAFKGISLEEASAELSPVHSALNRWVNRAIVSPNAAIRPTRASDPHFAMFFQFKSFTYAFQETTLRYALREAKHGNMEASARLLTAVPIMIASDMAKAMVMGGGSLPSYMARWTLADWVGHGINRGLSSVPQMGTEAISDPLSLFGPTVSQAGDVLASPFQGDVLKTGLDAVPGLRYARSALDGAVSGA